MARIKSGILLAGVILGVFAGAIISFADEPVANETLLKEIRELKNIVNQQAKKIIELESRVTRQESGGASAVTMTDIPELDKKIDERLARKAPAYELLEGLSLEAGMTTVVQTGRNVNGDSQLSAKEDATSATAKVNIALDKQFGDYGEGFVYLKSGNGAGLDAKLKTFSTVNDSADDDGNVRLVEAWYEHKFTPMSGVLTFGKLDPTGYIDTNEYANDESIQFLGGMFVNSPVVDFSDNSLGLHYGASPFEFLDLSLEALDADGDGQDTFDAMFLGAQINFKPKLLGKGGNYRFYAWQNNSNHMKWRDSAEDKEKSFGYGLSFDQELTGIVGIFFRYGWQDPDVFTPAYDAAGALDWSGCVYSLEQSWSIGPQFKGSAWGRPDDVTGIAFGQIMPSDEYKKYYAGLSGATDPQAKNESHLEWYYSYKVNDHLILSPDLQIIWSPYGKDAANGDGTIVVGGLRGQMDF